MIAGVEQRNAYKGVPPRPWLRIRVVSPTGTSLGLELVADTGNPCSVIVGEDLMQQFRWAAAAQRTSNFGILNGGWLKIELPELHRSAMIVAYANDAVSEAARASHSDFGGLAGLPLLRMWEYGGNRSEFWLRTPAP